jgi:hypothetical protein
MDSQVPLLNLGEVVLAGHKQFCALVVQKADPVQPAVPLSHELLHNSDGPRAGNSLLLELAAGCELQFLTFGEDKVHVFMFARLHSA